MVCEKNTVVLAGVELVAGVVWEENTVGLELELAAERSDHKRFQLKFLSNMLLFLDYSHAETEAFLLHVFLI